MSEPKKGCQHNNKKLDAESQALVEYTCVDCKAGIVEIKKHKHFWVDCEIVNEEGLQMWRCEYCIFSVAGPKNSDPNQADIDFGKPDDVNDLWRKSVLLFPWEGRADVIEQ